MFSSNRLRRPLAAALQIAFVASLLWSSLYGAWVSLAAVDFGYPLLYRVYDIPSHIALYGPRNLYKRGFETTSDEQRLAIFGQIAQAVDSGGAGLEKVQYVDAGGRSRPFLRQPERVHLQSVARLVEDLKRFSWAVLLVLAGSGALLWAARVGVPRVSRILLGTLAAGAMTTVMLLLIGPERVFNTLHTWIFPPGEQWFFYYEESLMTTLMKAPDLFGGIAVLLALTALAYFAVALFAARRLLTPGSG